MPGTGGPATGKRALPSMCAHLYQYGPGVRQRWGRRDIHHFSCPCESQSESQHCLVAGQHKAPQPRKGCRALVFSSSGDRTRTCDPLINSQLLYQLSYAGSSRALRRTTVINKLSRAKRVNQSSAERVGHIARPLTGCSIPQVLRRARSPTIRDGVGSLI